MKIQMIYFQMRKSLKMKNKKKKMEKQRILKERNLNRKMKNLKEEKHTNLMMMIKRKEILKWKLKKMQKMIKIIKK